MKNVNLVYGVKDNPGLSKTLVFAFQQVLAILAATILVPAIVGNGMSQSAALFGAGVGTIVYLLFTKFRSPVFLGSSFAFITPMFAAFGGGVAMSVGYLGLVVGAFLAGLVYVVIALVVKFAGTKWIDKVMPAAVIGPTVAIIGLSLSVNAVKDVIKGAVWDADTSAWVMNGTSTISLLCAIVTLFTVIICSVYGKKMVKMIPFILGIAAGYLVATIFTVIGEIFDLPKLVIINFSLFKDMSWVPDFAFIEAFKGFKGFTGTYFVAIIAA